MNIDSIKGRSIIFSKELSSYFVVYERRLYKLQKDFKGNPDLEEKPQLIPEGNLLHKSYYEDIINRACITHEEIREVKESIEYYDPVDNVLY